MIKFPSIEQYRNVIRQVKDRAQYMGQDEDGNPIFDRNAKPPTLKFRGYTKLHGSNAAIVKYVEKAGYVYQSRENILSLDTNTLNGFLVDMEKNLPIVDGVFATIREVFGDEKESLAVFGEWCGGSIQKGVALNQLTKRFVVFAVKKDDIWQDIEHLKSAACFNNPVIHLVANYASWEVEIDFGSPEYAQNVLVDITNQVEKQCPYGFAHGADGIGEGVVWHPVGEEWNSSKYWFKVKGEKHSTSKVKTVAPIDLERVASIKEAAEKFATENRIEQGITVLRDGGEDMSQSKAVGPLIQWVMRDIIKEESEALIESGLDGKAINGEVAKRVREHFLNSLASV